MIVFNKHDFQLDSASSETKILKAQNMSSELTVTPMSANTEEVDCSDLTQQAKDEISSLKRQVNTVHQNKPKCFILHD